MWNFRGQTAGTVFYGSTTICTRQAPPWWFVRGAPCGCIYQLRWTSSIYCNTSYTTHTRTHSHTHMGTHKRDKCICTRSRWQVTRSTSVSQGHTSLRQRAVERHGSAPFFSLIFFSIFLSLWWYMLMVLISFQGIVTGYIEALFCLCRDEVDTDITVVFVVFRMLLWNSTRTTDDWRPSLRLLVPKGAEG